MSKYIPYSRQTIGEDDIEAVVEALRSDIITQGPRLIEFENSLASYCEAKYAIAFSSGTAALHAAYYTAGIGDGDEIITSPITFVATANAALYLGAKPVFVDVEPDTGNIDPALIEEAITERTRAIVPIHFAGHPADMDAILEIAGKRNLTVIEDACHAMGASYKGRKIGSISDMTVFSFHPLKPITTGEGGAVLTDNKEFKHKLELFRSHGITKDKAQFESPSPGEWYYEMQELGFNYRMNDIQAALGNSQLKKLDSFIKAREVIAVEYNKAFKANPWFDLPAKRQYARSSQHLYPVRLNEKTRKDRPAIFNKLRERGLGVQVHYIPVYHLPYYQKAAPWQACPEADTFYASELSLPIHQAMNNDDVATVIEEVRKCLQQ